MLEFRYWLCNLAEYDDSEFQGAAWLQVSLLLMKYILRNELVDRLPEIVRLLRTLYAGQVSLAYVEAALRYVVNVHLTEPEPA